MNVIQRMWWKYTGWISTIVVEMYDDTADAVIHPLVGLAVTAFCASFLVSETASTSDKVAALIGTIMFGTIAVAHIGATYVYATEPQYTAKEVLQR